MERNLSAGQETGDRLSARYTRFVEAGHEATVAGQGVLTSSMLGLDVSD